MDDYFFPVPLIQDISAIRIHREISGIKRMTGGKDRHRKPAYKNRDHES